jgi:hypothetical protein
MPEEGKRILDLSEKIFEVLGPDKQLAVEFFAVFSRFEYALKRNQYLKEGEKKASADWDGFARNCLCPNLISNPETANKIRINADYLLKPDNLPKEQIRISKGIDWKIPKREPKSRCCPSSCPSDCDICWIVRLIKIVRNNLFHGGKYLNNEWPVDPKRDTQLVEVSLLVLNACLELEEVKKEFCGDELRLSEDR